MNNNKIWWVFHYDDEPDKIGGIFEGLEKHYNLAIGSETYVKVGRKPKPFNMMNYVQLHRTRETQLLILSQTTHMTEEQMHEFLENLKAAGIKVLLWQVLPWPDSFKAYQKLVVGTSQKLMAQVIRATLAT